MKYMPPYLNKFINSLNKEFLKAEKNEIKAKSKLEFMTEYKNLCKEKLDKALDDEKK